jgi:hypothetical protein
VTVDEFKVMKEWESHGLLCRVVRNGLGSHNGYVRVGKGHPFFRVKYHETAAIAPNKARLKDNIDELGFDAMIAALGGKECVEEWMSTPGGYVKVHGGVTFSDSWIFGSLEGAKGEWWFGFDTGHLGDYQPFNLRMRETLLEVAKEYPDLHIPNYVEKWKAYINRIKSGEMPRDIAYEASLEQKHYWTVEETGTETEKMAEQLSVIQLLGVKTKVRRKRT